MDCNRGLQSHQRRAYSKQVVKQASAKYKRDKHALQTSERLKNAYATRVNRLNPMPAVDNGLLCCYMKLVKSCYLK
jgi:hypothetical protein